MNVIGVDIGGTNVKVGLIKDGKLFAEKSVPTNNFDLIKQVTSSVIDLIKQKNMEISQFVGVGVGCPGIIHNGVVVDSANLNLSNFNMQQVLLEQLGIDVIVKNDADMATIAEHKLGAGNGVNNMIMLTVGTGLGGGIIINGNIYEGEGGAGELGHITYVPNGIACGCGRRGCIEKYVSCTALTTIAKEQLANHGYSELLDSEDIFASDIAKAYLNGDQCAKKIVDIYVEYLSDAILNYCNVFRPQKIIIGGGLTYAPTIIDLAIKRCHDFNYGYINSKRVEIERANLGNNAGMLGAYVCFDKSKKTK